MSQLLQRLQNELSNVTAPIRRVELLSQMALHLSRLGRFDEANKCIKDARKAFPGGEGGAGTLWVMLAEGLLLFFEKQSPQALDRVTRAQILAIALRYARLTAVSSAWKAHIEFESSNFAAMVVSLKLAKQNTDASNHDVNARVALVLNNAFALAGKQNEAKKWFLIAHRHSVDGGDQASIDALTYNKAALELARLRVENCLRRLDSDELARLRAEIFSSANLTSLVRITALNNYWHLMEARLLLLEGRNEEALIKFDAIGGQSPFASNHLTQKYLNLEIVFCKFRMGRAEDVSEELVAELEAELEDMDTDETVVGIWMLLKMAECNLNSKMRLQAKFDRSLENHRRTQAEIFARLQDFVF